MNRMNRMTGDDLSLLGCFGMIAITMVSAMILATIIIISGHGSDLHDLMVTN